MGTYDAPISDETAHGTAWAARIRAEHERLGVRCPCGNGRTTSAQWCEMEYDGTDTNGDVWNRCKVHGFLVYGDAYVCEGYVAEPYRGGF